MPNGMRWVGLDVHAHASAVAVFDDVSGEVITRRVVGWPVAVLEVLRELPRPLRAVYEAGPTGYGLVRRARAEGIEMAVCSPGNIERRPNDRIKTDKRDAIRLARLFAAGDLRLVWVPGEEQEQLRDLVRCREDLRADLMRARLRLGALLLRRERYFPGPGERWTPRHRHWLSQQRFDDAPSRVTYADYLHAHDVLLARRELVARARADRIRLRLVRDDRALALPARHQHADRARAVRGDRRLEPLRASRLDRQVRRVGPVRAQLRPDAPAGQDHKGRLHPRSPVAGRGRAALPAHAGGRRQARAPPTRPGPSRHRSGLAHPAPSARALEAAARGPRQAGRRGHDRDRARADRRPRRTRPYSKQEAADALMEELHRWREQLGHFLDDEGGHPYSPGRSWTSLVTAHKAGKLLEEMTDWLKEYKGLSNDPSATSMTQIVKAGQRTWEHILLEPHKPWTPYVTDAQRAKLLECVRDCYARATSEMTLRAKMQEQ